jgi:hypothetical protein
MTSRDAGVSLRHNLTLLPRSSFPMSSHRRQRMRHDNKSMPLHEVYTAIEPWACEACCGHFCHILSVEASSRFLKVGVRCPTCGNRPILFWDLENHDWVETDENSDSIGECVGSFNSKAGQFDVKKFGRKIGLEGGIDTTAPSGPNLTEHQLSTCFNMLFEHSCHVSFLRQL